MFAKEAWEPEFDFLEPLKEWRGGSASRSCPLTSTPMRWHVHYTHHTCLMTTGFVKFEGGPGHAQ